MSDRMVMPLAQLNMGSTAPATAGAPAGGGGVEVRSTVTSAPAGGGGATMAGGGTGVGSTSTSAPGTAPATQAAPTGGLLQSLGSFLPIILMFVVLYFILFRGQRKEEKRRKGLIAELKKGDRVMTIGGMVARVVSIEGDEVVLKIDESQNVKAVYRKSAIQEVLTGEEKSK